MLVFEIALVGNMSLKHQRKAWVQSMDLLVISSACK